MVVVTVKNFGGIVSLKIRGLLMPDSYDGETLQPFLLKAGPLHTTSNRPNALNQPFLPHTISASVSNVTTAFIHVPTIPGTFCGVSQ